MKIFPLAGKTNRIQELKNCPKELGGQEKY